MNGGKAHPLRTDADLYMAMLFQTPVAVYCLGAKYDPSAGGCVETFDDEHVVIRGQHYSRKVCEIRPEPE